MTTAPWDPSVTAPDGLAPSSSTLSAGATDEFPTSHMQMGMMFQSMYAPGAGVYVQQQACHLDEAVDPDRLRIGEHAAAFRTRAAQPVPDLCTGHRGGHLGF